MKEKFNEIKEKTALFITKLKKLNWKKILIIAGIIVAVSAAVFFAIPKKINLIIDDAGVRTEKTYETRALTVGSFLENRGVTIDEENDRPSCETNDIIWGNMDIVITKSFNITITADGKSNTYKVLPGTVETILKQENIRLGKYDETVPELTDEIITPTDIVVRRGELKIKTVKEAIDHETVEQNDSSVTIGNVQIVQTGEDGSKDVKYRILYLDGKESRRTVVNETVTKEPVTEIIGVGTGILSGAPSDYSKKISMKAVAYYMSGNPSGSYGMPCTYGTVAVDPSVIPLGTRIYIEGYGYAIANDVGSSIKGNIIDLYMERYDQCLIWGARYTDVYIL